MPEAARRSLTALLLVFAAFAPAQAADLALKRVMLSSGGVGYFEYAADVDGPVALGLDVPLGQVDDVLKSLVVFDSAGGVGGLELPGRDASHTAFGDVPFGPEALGSPLDFLNSLQGVEVTVQGPRPMTGRVLQAERVHETASGQGNDSAERTRVTVITGDGLRQFVLEDADAVQITDPGLRDRVTRALAALRRESGQDARHITIRSAGSGPRTIRVGYVAAAPLWKASYRLVLPPPDADPAKARARMQGWATLENASGTDWNGVELILQYGNPVTFHQAIYRSYFVARPDVPVEVLGRLLPDVDTRARSGEAAVSGAPEPTPGMPSADDIIASLQSSGAASTRGIRPLAIPAPAGAKPPPPAAPPPMMAAPALSVQASEGTEETVFPLPAPVTLASGHSASVPVLDRELPSDRIALAQMDQPHPLASVKVTNDAGVSLPAGVLTLYDATGPAPYAGDARLGGLPAGDSRLLSFAQDLRTTLEWRHTHATTLAALTAASGVLHFDERDRHIVRVVLTAPANEPRHILLAVPRFGDQTLAPDFAHASEETAAAWRFSVQLRPGESQTLVIAIDRIRRQVTSLLDDESTMARLLDEQGLSDAAKAAFDRLARLRATEASRGSERDRLQAQLDAVIADEGRLRDNLGAVSAGDALRGRLVRQLDADETRIAQLHDAVAKANDAVGQAHQALADAVTSLRV